jgi:hypothetical protein
LKNKKRTLSLLIYYFLDASLTNLVFVLVGASVFILVSHSLKLDTILIVIVFFALLLKSLLVGFITYFAQKKSLFDKESGTKFIGFYFGRFFSLIIGGFLGFEIAQGIGAIIGAVSFYFIGRWLGPKVSFLICHLLDSNFSIADISEKVIAKPSLLMVIAYAVIFPWFMVLSALLFKLANIQFADTTAGWLPIARIVVIVISLYSLIAPWFLQKLMSKNQMANFFFVKFWLGLVVSIIPVICGFMLFTMGASIIEVGIFAAVSSLAAIIWSIKANSEDQKAD